jgi:hypothetical protein
MTTKFRARLGTHRLGTVAIGLLNISLAPSIYANYDNALSQFFAFCAEEGLKPLHATYATVVRYTAWVGLLGKLAAGSLQHYFSAVNKYFRDHKLPSIAVGELLADARRGLEMQRHHLVLYDNKLPPHVSVALDILMAAVEIRRSMEWTPASPPLIALFGLR